MHPIREESAPSSLATRNKAMRDALDELLRAARSEVPIMFRAELGSEVAALGRLAHDNSPRGGHLFVSLLCPSMSELPSQEFDCGGSLFLEEIGGLAPPLQAGLVRVLDDASKQRATARVMSSTKVDLAESVLAGRFRRDLFFRLNVVEVRIPPLRERAEDILPLARDVIASLSADLGRSVPELSREAEAMLLEHQWPGNLRELRNVIERAFMLRSTDVIDREDLAMNELADVVEPAKVR